MVDQTKLDELRRAFAHNGYVILRGILDAPIIAELNADIDHLMAEKGMPDAHTEFAAAFRFASVMNLVENGQVLPVVVNLLGYNLQLHVSSLSVKRPVAMANGTDFAGGKIPSGYTSASLNWHRDGPSPQFPYVPDFSLKVCYILSDLTEPGRGNTKVLPGSHLDPAFCPPHGDSNVPVPGEVEICGAPGDVMIFTQNLWHGACYNTSPIERRLAFIGYGPSWTRPLDYRDVPPDLFDGASPILRQLLGEVGPRTFNHYLPEKMPLSEFWYGDQPTSSYAH